MDPRKCWNFERIILETCPKFYTDEQLFMEFLLCLERKKLPLSKDMRAVIFQKSRSCHYAARHCDATFFHPTKDVWAYWCPVSVFFEDETFRVCVRMNGLWRTVGIGGRHCVKPNMAKFLSISLGRKAKACLEISCSDELHQCLLKYLSNDPCNYVSKVYF